MVAEAGELLEPRRQRLQWAEIAPLYSSLAPGNKTRLSQKKKKNVYYNLSLGPFNYLTIFSIFYIF